MGSIVKRRDFIRLWAIMNGNLIRGKIVSYTLEPFFMLSRVSAEARNFTFSGYAEFRLQDYPQSENNNEASFSMGVAR